MDTPASPAPPPHPDSDEDSHDAHRSHLVLWLVAAAAAFLLLAGGVGYWWRATHEQSPPAGRALQQEDRVQSTPAAADDIDCEKGMIPYQDQSFGFAFCYPEEWGKADVRDDRFEPADPGSRWMISFPDKPAVRMAFVSDTWTTNVGRDGGCADPAKEVAYDHFSAAWQTETDGTDISYAARDVSSKANVYRIEEYTDNLLTNGVCLRAYASVNTTTYRHLTLSYYAAFSEAVTSPKQHIDAPETLIPVSDRQAIAAVVASARRFGN